jgi:hypothetical protein
MIEDDETQPPRASLPLGNDPPSVRRRVEALERVMERLIVIPGLERPLGLDAILSLIPFAGSTAGAAIGAYMMWEARNLGMSKWQMARMSGNTAFDWLLGLIPGFGIIPDFFFRANSRNLKIIKRHLDKHHAAGETVQADSVRRVGDAPSRR